MSTFTLAISCLTTSNLPWFINLTFQVPMQYCSLQHRTLLLSPVTSAAGYYVCFGSIPSFFVELFLHWSSVKYWVLTDLGSSSFSILSFCLFILFMGFSKQECWFCYTKINVEISRKNMTVLPNVFTQVPFPLQRQWLYFNTILPYRNSKWMHLHEIWKVG